MTKTIEPSTTVEAHCDGEILEMAPLFEIETLLVTSGADEKITALGEAVVNHYMPEHLKADKVAMDGAINGFKSGAVSSIISRIVTGDWGETNEEDAAYNDTDVKHIETGSRVVCKYSLGARAVSEGVIDKADVVTLLVIAQGMGPDDGGIVCTLMLPSDY